MAAWRLRTTRNQQISVLLIIALLFITIWPSHIHVRHADETAGHGHSHAHQHIVDLHANANDIDASHHQDAQVLKVSPDGMLKPPFIKVLPFLLLAIVLAVLAVTLTRLNTRHHQLVFIPTGYQFHHSPPLRGPPVIS